MGGLSRLRTVLFAAALLPLPSGAAAQEEPRPGQFLTLSSPITDEAIGGVRRAALALRDRAAKEGREAVLVLEIAPGASQFHHVYALADYLTSPAASGLRTVAWIPETVTGNNAIVALACREIVMAPEALLGDIGRGERLPAEQEAVVLELVGRGNNRLVSRALASAMLDPSRELLQLTVESADGQRERRLATPDEAKDIAASGAAIPESQVIKEPGLAGAFSGAQARADGFLVHQLADSRRAVADLYELPPEAMRETPLLSSAQSVSLIEVEGNIDSVQSTFLQRQLHRAIESGSELIIFELHSPGGSLEEVRDLSLAIARLEEHGVRTAAWAPEMATGEAALIALGCDEIYLTPKARFGAVARRRNLQLGGLPQREQKFLLDSLRELAELKRRPAAVLMAMADPKLQVFQATNENTGEMTYFTEEELEQNSLEWLRGPLVPESGHGLLTVSGLRAQQLMIAESPVEGFGEVRHRLGLPDELKPLRIEKTWVDELVFLLNRRSVTGILFTLALICIYIELHFMTGFLGIISMTCFSLFFWSRFLGGTAGSLEILLFMLGLGCLAVELLVLPGFGAFGVMGAGMVLASLVMASQTFGNIESGRDITRATETLKTISISLLAVVGMGMLLSRFLPRLPFFKEMVLTPPGYVEDAPSEPRLMPEPAEHVSEIVGMTGAAYTALRPAGKARINGRLMDVVSNGAFIEAGRDVEVVSAVGNHVVVRQV